MLRDNLIMLRNINCFSQEEVAEKIGISRQAYAKWESGKTIPDIEKCSLLAEVYGVTIDSLIKTNKLEGRIVPPAPEGKNIWGSVTLNDRGQIVIPKAARDHFGFSEGQRLILMSSDGEGFVLVPAEWFEKRLALLGQIAADK